MTSRLAELATDPDRLGAYLRHGDATSASGSEPEAPIIREPEAPIIREPEAPIIREPEAPITREPEAPANREPD